MPQLTLLDVVQSYFTATSGWVVNSIGDLAESEQVSLIAQEVFYEVVNEISNWKFEQKILQLDSLADSDKPNYLVLPDNLSSVKFSFVNYNCFNLNDTTTIKYKEVPYISPTDFLCRMNKRQTTLQNTEIVTDYSGVKFVVLNNAHPSFCTSIDDKYVIFDSYNSTVDDTLHANKTQILGQVEKVFRIEDNYVIDLPNDFTPIYLNLVKSRASEYLRQEPLYTDSRLGKLGLMKYKNHHQKIGNESNNHRRRRYGR